MGPNSVPARVLLAVMTAGGFMVVLYDTLHKQPLHPLQFGLLVLIAVVASRFKVKLPGLNGNMSVNLPFILIAMIELSVFEALIVALCSTAAQCLPKRCGKLKAIQVLFNVSTMAVAVGLAGLIFQARMPLPTAWVSGSLLLVLAGATFFLVQTIPVAAIISLTEGGRVLRIWSSIFHLSFPYYVLSAGVTSIVTTASHRIGWPIPFLVLPAMYGVYRSYRLYFGQAATLTCTVVLAKAAGTTR